VTADLASGAEPSVRKPDALLVVDGVRKRFGGLLAVDVDHLEISRGKITALIGPNGAGKTTLFNVLTGCDRPSAGEWSFDGRAISRMSTNRIARAGMVRTFQLTRSLNRLTVLDNMLLAGSANPGERLSAALLKPLWQEREEAVAAKAAALLDRFGLAAMAGQLAGTLSGGQRKLLEIARALMTEPRLLMLDEPMAGVNPALTQSLLGHITALRDGGLTVLFVEHDMDVVMAISDWVVCMAQGRIIAEGPPDAIAADPTVVDAYLGAGREEPAVPDPAALEKAVEAEETKQEGEP
jgi:neutral amino acid transport system ATP-binding protein